MSAEEAVTLTEIRPSPAAKVAALLSFSRGGTYQVEVTSPSDETLSALNDAFLHEGVTTKEVRALAGDVFDRDLRRVFPFSESDDAGEADERLHQLRTDWNRALVASPNLMLVVEGGTRIHRIPWEFVAARPYGRLSHDSPIIRKLTGYAPPAEPPADQPLRILLVIARPYGPIDVSHRRVADALLRTGIDREHWPIVDVLRGGGTFQQLTRRLSEKCYQVVHFDMHGMQENDGGFLEFESEVAGQSDVKQGVGAAEVADLLLEKQVQLALFTSCESARPSSSDGSYGRSLAHEVARGGVPAAIGMSQPISADGAKNFAVLFYEALFNGHDRPIATAVANAKTAFRTQLERGGGERSEEWRLPTLFLRSDPLFTIHHAGLNAATESLAVRPDYIAREHRDFDHRLVDRLVFVNDRPVLIRGLRHTGKRAFLHDLETWWRLAQFATQHASANCVDRSASVASQLAHQLKCDLPTGGDEHAQGEVLLSWIRGVLDAADPDEQFVFYLAAVDRVSENERELIRQLGELARQPAVHLVMSARARPEWLTCELQEFDMLWLNSQAARDLFIEIAGRPDDLLIAACSDLPGVVKELAQKIDDWPEGTDRYPATYYDHVLPDAEAFRHELVDVDLDVDAIIPFGGIKGFPLPIIETSLLIRYLRDCRRRGLIAQDADEVIRGVQRLGYLSPISGQTHGVFLRLHPYLPLLARRALREKLRVGPQMTDLDESQLQAMSVYSEPYDAMTEIRQRKFELLRSGRRVERWYLKAGSVQYVLRSDDSHAGSPTS